MTDSQSDLIVQFDDFMNCSRILWENSCLEDFRKYLERYETLLSKHNELHDKCKRLKEALDESVRGISTLHSKLKKARQLLDTEKKQALRLENERDAIAGLLDEVCRIVCNDTRCKIPEETNNRLAVIISNNGYWRRSINRFGSQTNLESSDNSITRSEDDLDDSRPHRSKHKLTSVEEEPYSIPKKKSLKYSPLSTLTAARQKSECEVKLAPKKDKFIEIGTECSLCDKKLQLRVLLKCAKCTRSSNSHFQRPAHETAHIKIASEETINGTSSGVIEETQDETITAETDMEEAKTESEVEPVTTISAVSSADPGIIKRAVVVSVAIENPTVEPEYDIDSSASDPFHENSTAFHDTSTIPSAIKETLQQADVIVSSIPITTNPSKRHSNAIPPIPKIVKDKEIHVPAADAPNVVAPVSATEYKNLMNNVKLVREEERQSDVVVWIDRLILDNPVKCVKCNIEMNLSSTNTSTASICGKCSKVQPAQKSRRTTTPIAEIVKRKETPVRVLRARADPGPAPTTKFKKRVEKKKDVRKELLPGSLSLTSSSLSLRCNTCGKTFKHKGTLKKHHSIHTGKKPFECAKCDHKFNHKTSLKRHMLNHGVEKPFKCATCSCRFVRRDVLKAHMLIHRSEKPFECATCGHKFNEKGNLKAHMLIHGGEKPFECETCGHKCNRKRNLKAHMLIHRGEKPFECATCRHKFNYKSSLKAHMLTHGGEKPFECETCGHKCNLKSNLKAHMLTHGGEKPFETCSRRFVKKDALKGHMLIHRGEKPFECATCGHKSRHKSDLKKHILIHRL